MGKVIISDHEQGKVPLKIVASIFFVTLLVLAPFYGIFTSQKIKERLNAAGFSVGDGAKLFYFPLFKVCYIYGNRYDAYDGTVRVEKTTLKGIKIKNGFVAERIEMKGLSAYIDPDYYYIDKTVYINAREAAGTLFFDEYLIEGMTYSGNAAISKLRLKLNFTKESSNELESALLEGTGYFPEKSAFKAEFKQEVVNIDIAVDNSFKLKGQLLAPYVLLALPESLDPHRWLQTKFFPFPIEQFNIEYEDSGFLRDKWAGVNDLHGRDAVMDEEGNRGVMVFGVDETDRRGREGSLPPIDEIAKGGIKIRLESRYTPVTASEIASMLFNFCPKRGIKAFVNDIPFEAICHAE